MVNGTMQFLVLGLACSRVPSVAAGHGLPDNAATWTSNMRAFPYMLLTAMALTAIMTGSAAAGLTLDLASERSYCEYYERAVHGDPAAQAGLAALYAEGDSVPQSDAYAFQWFMRAAGQGHARAQLRLSEIFLVGKGVPRNNIAAYKWALVAVATAQEPEASEKAAQRLKILAPLMSQAEIAKARSLAADWRQAPELQAYNAQATEKRLCRPGARIAVRTGSSTPSRPKVQLPRKRVEPADHIARRLRSLGRHLRARMIWAAGQ